MRISILGPQGSGKGTQAKRIAAAYDVPHVATGDILRAAVAERLRARARRCARSSSAATSCPTSSWSTSSASASPTRTGFVLDGFPRTMRAGRGARRDARRDRQAARRGDPAAGLRRGRDRAAARARAPQEGRADDSPEAIANRLRLYHELTELVVDRYQLAGIEVIVDGEQTMDEVFAAIQDALRGGERAR